MTLNEIITIFNAKQKGNNYEANCPSHDDKTPSLCISQGNNGGVVMKCQAGCPTEKVLAAKGLKFADLMPTNPVNPIPVVPVIPKIVNVYDYVDADGKLLYQVCRYKPKDFKQRRPDPDKPGSWLWNMNGMQRVLYRLPQVIAAVKEGKTIFLTEGEKATGAAEAVGLIATNAPGGAGKWKDEYTQYLKGANCIILPDADEPGRAHAKQVHDAIYGTAKSVRIVELPDLPEKGDIYDFIATRVDQDSDAIKNEIIDLSTPEEFYYEKHSKEYLLRNKRKSWMSLAETQFKKELLYRGMNNHTQKGQNVSEVDEFIINLRDTRDIDYAGPLAGYMAGFYEMNGYRVLVTESPKIIQPINGEWKTIESLIKGLLFDETKNQIPFLFGWIKLAYQSLCTGHRRPGQTLAMCGPHDCGKSLLQLLITQILGGRSAKPYSYMTESTDFNGELFTAEHLCIEDEPANTDLRVRRAFGAQIKQIAGCDTQRHHAKHKQAITLTPFWRLTISLNNEAENLMVLPPIDNSIEDKIILLKAVSSPMPMPTGTDTERNAFWNQLILELPAFLDYLCNWKIPEHLKKDRYGIIHFHHPELLREIDALSPEFRLLAIIDKEIFGVEIPFTWNGTAADLEAQLTAKGDFQYESRKLLSWGNATGTYLGRLAKKFPDRFIKTHTENAYIWKIEPPSTLSLSADS